MSRLRRSWLPLILVVMLASLICMGVWIGGSFVFGIPTASDRIGEPAPGLNPVQEMLLSALLFIRHDDLDAPVSDPESMIAIEVQEGETADDVIGKLVRSGFLHDGVLLRSYLRYRGLDRGIEVGEYFLHGGMSIRQIAQTLQSAQPFASTLTIPEGWRREQIAALIDTFDFQFSGQDFLEASSQARPGMQAAAYLPPGASLEGYLFPDTYRINKETVSQDLVEIMQQTFFLRVSAELIAGFEAQGLSLHEAVTLASIVEREAVAAEERPRIAAVFLNRLDRGLKLETDPSVQFALGLQPSGSWWKTNLTAQDLQIDNPYNTYLYPGLPPGPIANPGLASLQAVAAPLETDELYFRALCDGSGRHAFARTFEEHLRNACP
ncbi:MAG: endolytic transglycosylase MltG [Anaerolineales bacterium]|nr:endolytic transglycosylase MltG [Anaerolineales bacterium]